MKIAIIGGGAAGLMALAAAREANPQAEIHLIERNEAVGRKILLTGGGRCNVTTGLTDVAEVLTRYPRGAGFLEDAMRAFPPTAVRAWFEAQGVPLKEEADRRIFPKSDDGRDVVAVFERLLREPKVIAHLKAVAEGIERSAGGMFQVKIRGLASPLQFDRVILTTGGRAYRETGSTGDGYAFAAKFGHVITPLAASLSALHVREKWAGELAGVSFARARMSVPRGGHEFTGPFVFTHRGLTGPAVFAVSSLIAHEPVSATEPLEMEIDFLPDETKAAATERLNRTCQQAPTRHFENVLTEFVPKALAAVVCRETKIPADRFAGKVSKKDMVATVAWLKGAPLRVIGRAAGEEFVTAGGVDLTEVNPATMESRLCPGLYFAGEILNIDAFTGGFNLQSAWATGRLAGDSAARIS
ncbi:MAG: aminoacetone oxidase family FAD-binding enzyme [Patescibacteria group bacterium]|nr:aminoacetone oxidase family FAD-binding enzyme [Patescibacteria group bacterium]